MQLDTFLNLPDHELAEIVHGHGEQVCVFPINGTRRWFLLEHAGDAGDDPIEAYMEFTRKREIALFKMIFDQGVDTLLSPMFGFDLMERGEVYIERVGVDGLECLASHPDFLAFYAAYGVRVHFYGDYRRVLRGTPYEGLIDTFEQAAERTAGNERRRLFFGVFANDAAELTAALGIEYFQKHAKAPDRKALVEMVYGEYVKPVDFFIGFDRFSAFDMPLLSTGSEDLYFTAAPSPYLDREQLRRILYDHLYMRRTEEQEYASMPPKELAWMRAFYEQNRGCTLGVGAVRDGIWYPLDQVTWPVGGDEPPERVETY